MVWGEPAAVRAGSEQTATQVPTPDAAGAEAGQLEIADPLSVKVTFPVRGRPPAGAVMVAVNAGGVVWLTVDAFAGEDDTRLREVTALLTVWVMVLLLAVKFGSLR
jgi:hypothetical protein